MKDLDFRTGQSDTVNLVFFKLFGLLQRKRRKYDFKAYVGMIMKRYVIDLVIQFLTKSILRPMVFTETTRQRAS